MCAVHCRGADARTSVAASAGVVIRIAGERRSEIQAARERAAQAVFLSSLIARV
jgi:hypothetical protein